MTIFGLRQPISCLLTHSANLQDLLATGSTYPVNWNILFERPRTVLKTWVLSQFLFRSLGDSLIRGIGLMHSTET
jgi:hypothetical protein